MVPVARDEASAVGPHADLGGAVVLPLEPARRGPERGHGLPASADGAGSRDAVALALETHLFADGLTSRPIVVQVHEGAGVSLPPLMGVDEASGEGSAVADVVGTAAPGELPHPVPVAPLLGDVTGAVHDGATTASSRDRLHNPRAVDGVDKGRFPRTSQNVSPEHRRISWNGGAVPTGILELLLAMLDAHRGTLGHGEHGVGVPLT